MNKNLRNNKIKSLYVSGLSMDDVAIQVRVSASTVYRIIHEANLARPHISKFIPMTKERFLEKVNILPNGCHEWKGTKNKDGYGRMRYNNELVSSHRFAYRAFVTPIPEGMLVCHSCDYPSCCNPDHLFLGTFQDNYDDMVKKGRERKAMNVNHHQFKATPETLAKVHEMYSKGCSHREMAEAIGVSHSTITRWINTEVFKLHKGADYQIRAYDGVAKALGL